jgi:hypothetical protein
VGRRLAGISVFRFRAISADTEIHSKHGRFNEQVCTRAGKRGDRPHSPKTMLLTWRPMPLGRYSLTLTMRYAESVEPLRTEHAMTSKKHTESKPKSQASPVESMDSRLDEALEESFPASDPIAVDPTEPRTTTETVASSQGKKKR